MEEKLDEILNILQEIKDDMGGIAAKKLMPKEESPMEDAMESPMDEMKEESVEIEPEMPEMADEEIEKLPRWKQRLRQFGNKKIG